MRVLSNINIFISLANSHSYLIFLFPAAGTETPSMKITVIGNSDGAENASLCLREFINDLKKVNFTIMNHCFFLGCYNLKYFTGGYNFNLVCLSV